MQDETIPCFVDDVRHRIVWLRLSNDVDVISWLQRGILPVVFEHDIVLVTFIVLRVEFLGGVS